MKSQFGSAMFADFVGPLAWEETRVLTVTSPLPDLPAGEYAFVEFYCADIECDCRRVILQVWGREQPGKTLATLNYGWESFEFYRDWCGEEDLAKEMTGATLQPLSVQTSIAPGLLSAFKGTVMQDEAYLKRLERHYALAKASLVKSTSPKKSRSGKGKEKASMRRKRGKKK